MTSDQYQIGDQVQVQTPHGWMDGKVVAAHQDYAWSGETKYEIHGSMLETIASVRLMRKVES